MGDWYEQPDGSWRYDPAAPTPGPHPAVTQMMPVVAVGPVVYDEFRDWPSPRPRYVYTDPVLDEGWPNITDPDGDPPDVFPPGWGTEPTARDQAAIDAGNA